MTKIIKSVCAILAGFVLIFVLAISFDHLFEHLGLMQTETFNSNAPWVIAAVVIGRFIFNIAGPYLTARLAPYRPMIHAMTLGIIGTLVNAGGSLMMWNKTPHWLPITLIILPLPCAWIAAKLDQRR